MLKLLNDALFPAWVILVPSVRLVANGVLKNVMSYFSTICLDSLKKLTE
jgi:hypothetical protein